MRNDRPDDAPRSGPFSRPTLAGLTLPDGQPRMSQWASLCVNAAGWGALTVSALNTPGWRSQRIWVGTGEHKVDVVVPAGARIEVRLANLFGSDRALVAVEATDQALDADRLKPPHPLGLDVGRLTHAVHLPLRGLTLKPVLPSMGIKAPWPRGIKDIASAKLRLSPPKLQASLRVGPLLASGLLLKIPQNLVDLTKGPSEGSAVFQSPSANPPRSTT